MTAPVEPKSPQIRMSAERRLRSVCACDALRGVIFDCLTTTCVRPALVALVRMSFESLPTGSAVLGAFAKWAMPMMTSVCFVGPVAPVTSMVTLRNMRTSEPVIMRSRTRRGITVTMRVKRSRDEPGRCLTRGDRDNRRCMAWPRSRCNAGANECGNGNSRAGGGCGVRRA